VKTAVPWATGALIVLGPLAYLRRQRRRFPSKPETSIESLRRLSRREFERVLSASFRLQGYAVDAREGSESGVRLVLRKPGQKILVQCIHGTNGSVDVEAVRELHQVMSSEAASGGLVVTSEQLSPEARLWVADKPIGLIEGRALLELVSRGGLRRPASTDPAERREPYLGPTLAELLDCPLCGAPMVLKQAAEPRQSEPTLFGCSVPRCAGTRPA
jgi:restriction system protein